MFNGLKTTGLKVVILIAFCLGIVQMSLLIRENNSLRSHLGRIIVLRQSMTELIEQAHRETADLSTRKGLLEKQLQIVSDRLTSHENTIDGVANPLKVCRFFVLFFLLYLFQTNFPPQQPTFSFCFFSSLIIGFAIKNQNWNGSGCINSRWMNAKRS